MLEWACRAWPLALAMLVVGACTITDPVRHEAYQRPIEPGARVLLMKPDIECSAVLASGLVEPNAVWTAEAERHVEAALRDMIQEQQAQVVTYDATSLAPEQVARHRELSRLYEAVAVSMVTRQAIPTASSRTTWTLGPGVRDIAADFDAEYALFLVLRDQYETAGRIATRMAAAAFGIGTTPAVQHGYASLIDLDSGDIVWFNRLFSTTGDLRGAEEARESVERLLEGCPVT
jgi:hypothetical protein